MSTYAGVFRQGRHGASSHEAAAPEWNIRPASDEVVEPALILQDGRKDKDRSRRYRLFGSSRWIDEMNPYFFLRPFAPGRDVGRAASEDVVGRAEVEVTAAVNDSKSRRTMR